MSLSAAAPPSLWAQQQQAIREVLLTNRVKLMKACDYFMVSSPLIAKRILSLEKHKELKNIAVGQDPKAANNALLDGLLQFLMDECTISPTIAFDAFLDGVRLCEGQKSFAKALKKEMEAAALKPGGSSGGQTSTTLIAKKPAAKPRRPKTPVNLGPGQNAIAIVSPSTKSQTGQPLQPQPTAKKKRQKQPAVVAVSLGPGQPILPPPPTYVGPTPPGFQYFEALSKLAPPQPSSGKPPSAKAPVKKPKLEPNPPEGGRRAAAQGQQSGGVGVAPLTAMSQQLKQDQAPASPGLAEILAAVARGAVPSSGAVPPATAARIQQEAPMPFIPRLPAGSPFKKDEGRSSKRGAATPKSKPLTFQEVDQKQKSVPRVAAFSFVSPAAVIRQIHYNNKSDLFYEGCPQRGSTQGSWCAKKVTLKGKAGKKYMCEDKHDNESYRLYPRLYVTFDDGTGQLPAVLYHENVEILSGRTTTEMQAMDSELLKLAFQTTVNKNIPIEVNCRRVGKKELKKTNGPVAGAGAAGGWENVASILLESPKLEAASSSTKR